MEKNI